MAKKDDLEKIVDVLNKFFKDKRITTSLKIFKEFGLTGWEKWWQMELGVFLAHDPNIAEWDIEHPFEVDKRTKLNQSRMALDIGFRLKSHKKDEWYFIELKQADSYMECIAKMSSDAAKVFSAKNSSFDNLKVRYIACAGIFLKSNEDAVLDYAEKQMDKNRIPFDDGFFVEEINEHHMMLVF